MRAYLALLDQGLVPLGELDPAALGLAPATPSEIIGGTPAENVALAHRILSGDVSGAAADCVSLNAALLLCVHRRNIGSLPDALAEVRRVLASGDAARLLARLSGGRDAS